MTSQVVEESRSGRWLRRGVTLPGYLLAATLAVALLPVTVVGALLADAFRRRSLATTRLVLFLTFYLLCESVGLLASFGAWLVAGPWTGRNPARYVAWNHRLERTWARALFAGTRRLFGLSLEVAGDEQVTAGPLLVFIRHASVGDTLLPAVLLSHGHDLRLRYVMKRELLWDPCLDVVGQRLPNAFVWRDSGRGEREVEAIRRLASDLGTGEGVLIYPEGTRFTAAKRQRALARIERSGDVALLARARALRHVLPPRLGGPLALLDAAPASDVLFLAHVGFEGTASFADLWRGSLIGADLRVRMWRADAADVPKLRADRITWLYEHWRRLDDWIDTVRTTAGRGGGSGT